MLFIKQNFMINTDDNKFLYKNKFINERFPKNFKKFIAYNI